MELPQVNSIRIHKRKCIDCILYDHSFIYKNYIVYARAKYGTNGEDYNLFLVDKQPQENQNYEDAKCTTDEKMDAIFLTKRDVSGSIWEMFSDIKESYSERTLEMQCCIEAKIIDIATQKITSIDFSDLKDGIIHTNNGDITKDYCSLGKIFQLYNYSVHIKTKIEGTEYDVNVSILHRHGNPISKHIIIRGVEPKDYNKSKSVFLWQSSKKFINHFICQKNDLSDVPHNFEFEWGNIIIEDFNDPHMGADGFITIQFVGDANMWKSNTYL